MIFLCRTVTDSEHWQEPYCKQSQQFWRLLARSRRFPSQGWMDRKLKNIVNNIPLFRSSRNSSICCRLFQVCTEKDVTWHGHVTFKWNSHWPSDFFFFFFQTLTRCKIIVRSMAFYRYVAKWGHSFHKNSQKKVRHRQTVRRCSSEQNTHSALVWIMAHVNPDSLLLVTWLRDIWKKGKIRAFNLKIYRFGWGHRASFATTRFFNRINWRYFPVKAWTERWGESHLLHHFIRVYASVPRCAFRNWFDRWNVRWRCSLWPQIKKHIPCNYCRVLGVWRSVCSGNPQDRRIRHWTVKQSLFSHHFHTI